MSKNKEIEPEDIGKVMVAIMKTLLWETSTNIDQAVQ